MGFYERWQRNPEFSPRYTRLYIQYPALFAHRKPWRRPLLEGSWEYATDEQVAAEYLKETFDDERTAAS